MLSRRKRVWINAIDSVAGDIKDFTFKEIRKVRFVSTSDKRKSSSFHIFLAVLERKKESRQTTLWPTADQDTVVNRGGVAINASAWFIFKFLRDADSRYNVSGE
jgi:hypothetical protein